MTEHSSPTSLRGWARALDIDVTTARKWLDRGVIVDGMGIEEAREAIDAARRSSAPAGGDDDEIKRQTAEANLELKRARAEMLRIQADKAAGAVIPAEMVRELWTTLTARWVAEMRAVPARESAALAEWSGREEREARVWLQRVIGRALDSARLDDV